MCEVLNIMVSLDMLVIYLTELVKLSNMILFLPGREVYSDTDKLLTCKTAHFVISVRAKWIEMKYHDLKTDLHLDGP